MTPTREIQLGSLRLGGVNPLFLIAGPCVIESETHARPMAERIAKIAADAQIPYIFKASYDKANRSSVKSFRGPGMTEGLRILGKIKSDLNYLAEVRKYVEIARTMPDPEGYLDQIDIERCGKSRILLNGSVRELHQANLRALYRQISRHLLEAS